MDDSNDDIQIISEERLPARRIRQNEVRRRLQQRRQEPHIIDVDEIPSDDDDEEVEIMEIRNLTPLPPPLQTRHVLHAPGRTFPIGRLHLVPTRSFPNTRSRTLLLMMTTRIRSPQEMERSYQQRRLDDRRRAQEIRNRFYRDNNNDPSQVNQRIWGMLPRDLSLGLGNLLFPGNINNLIFRNEDSETDGDYSPHHMMDEERETEFWINRIQQLEAQENDERISKRLKFSENYKKQLLTRINNSNQQKLNYFNSIKEEKQPSCLQCGVELGEGIPSNFSSSSSSKTLIDWCKETRIPAPYQYFKSFSESDILNSKKVFFSKSCGHTYCGRCIQYFKKLTANNKLKKVKVNVGLPEIGEYVEIYENGEPIVNLRKCCGFQCNSNLHKFYEVYF